MRIKDFIKLCGEKETARVMFYECDERESITITVCDLLEDNRYEELLISDIASWDYDDGILCIYYFREEN